MRFTAVYFLRGREDEANSSRGIKPSGITGNAFVLLVEGEISSCKVVTRYETTPVITSYPH
jgi:hypothetical protein